MKQETFPLGRKENIVVQKLDNEVLVYDLQSDKAVCLNKTSAIVWQMCDGKKSVSEISQSIAGQMNAPVNEELVWLAIEQFKKENLLVNGDNLPSVFEGMNRREVIRKIGLGTMVALPIISSLIAPNAANAASAGRFAGTFQAPGDACAPGDVTARDITCSPARVNCASGNAVSQPGTCTFNPATGISDVDCVCA